MLFVLFVLIDYLIGIYWSGVMLMEVGKSSGLEDIFEVVGVI